MGWPIVGRFKAEGGGIGGHIIPIAGVTSSGMDFFKWAQQFAYAQCKANRKVGWAFINEKGK